MFYFFLTVGLILRIFLIPVPGFKADVAFWKGWGLAAADKGIVWMITNTGYNYPPGFAYILWIINKIYGLFFNAHNINEYWLDSNIFYLFLLKLIIIFADLLIVFLIIKIVDNIAKQHFFIFKLKVSLGQLLALFYFLNPVAFYDGVIWGQVDQLGVALFLTAVYLVLINKPKWSALIFTVAFSLKLQNIIFIPVFYLFIWKKYSWKELMLSLKVSILTFLIISLPFVLIKQMDQVIKLFIMNADWFPWYSLNAFNIWWILSGLKGMQVVDKHLIIGITTAKQIGLFAFILAYFSATVLLLFSKTKDLIRNFMITLVFIVFAFFNLLTQSHERYLFPITALLPILFAFYIPKRLLVQDNRSFNLKNKEFISFSIYYLILTIILFFNMYLTMGWNYPDQVLFPFSQESTLTLSLIISVIQIFLFIVFVIYEAKHLILENALVNLFFVMILIMVLITQNINFILNKPISLTSLKPVNATQDYLSLAYDKTVESTRGVNYWNRLSVNYYYYRKGIGSHANSVITYHLAQEFSKFSTDFGLDTEGDQSAKVYFTILGDNKELFKSQVKGRFDSPGTTSVDVRGINYLTLRIVKAGESIYGAHADWLDPTLYR